MSVTLDRSPPAIETQKMFLLNGRALNVARTVVHYFMFVILGLMMSIPGPTLLDLRHSSGTDAHTIPFIFTAKSLGYMVGSLTGGVVLDYIKHEQIALIISSFVVSLGAYIIPWCRSLPVLLGTFTAAGFAMGFSNTGSNAGCLRIWGNKGAPFLQGLHFAYGLGGFLAPILAAPFLSAQMPIAKDLSLLGVTQNLNLSNEFMNDVQNVTENELKIIASDTAVMPTIVIPYSIIGVLASMVCGCFIFVFVVSPNENSDVNDGGKVEVKDPGLTFTVIVVILACLLTGFISGVEVTFAQMLTSYAVKSTHNLSKSTGSYMTSVYWGTFTVTRAVSIALTCKIRVKYLLIFDLILSVTSTVILLTIGTWSVYALWIGTGLLGIGVASVFPATLSWVEKHIDINNRIASVFTLMCSILEMCAPYSISMYLDSRPNVLFEFITSATIASCLVFATLNVILTRKGEKYVTEETPPKQNEAIELKPALPAV